MSELQTKDAVMNTANDSSSQYSEPCRVVHACDPSTQEAASNEKWEEMERSPFHIFTSVSCSEGAESRGWRASDLVFKQIKECMACLSCIWDHQGHTLIGFRWLSCFLCPVVVRGSVWSKTSKQRWAQVTSLAFSQCEKMLVCWFAI